MKKILLMLLLPCLLTACSLLPQTRKISIAYLPGSVQMHVNQDVMVEAVITPQDAAESVQVSYRSEDESVAAVDFAESTIIVHGRKPGVTRVRSEAAGQKEFSFLVTVKEEYLSINLDKSSAVLCSGQQLALEASLRGGDPYACEKISWDVENNNNNVVILGNGGSVTAIACSPGLVKITASLGSKTAACDVLIQTSAANANAYITAYTSSIALDAGKDKQLAVELKNGTMLEQQKLMWSVENPAVVSLMGQGSTAMITGLSGGQTKIKVYHPGDPALQFFFYIKVNTLLVTISLNKTGIFLKPGETATVAAAINNGTETDYLNLVWSVPPDALNTVSLLGYGKTISVLANNTGYVKINATLPGDIIAYCDVLVADTPSGGVAARYITAGKTTMAMDLGKDTVLTASLVNGTPIDQNELAWASSDSSVLTITGSGSSVIVTPAAAGTAQVSISHPDAINTFTIFVKVNDAYSTISLNVTGLSLDVGDEYLLRAVCKGTSLDFASIGWVTEPENQDVLSILGRGESVTLMANNPGSVTVTARTAGGSAAACDVLVRERKSISTSPSVLAMKTGEEEIVYINKSPANLQVTVNCTNSPVINYAYNEAQNLIRITAVKEGTASLQVAGGGIMAKTDCIVTEDKFFGIDRLSLNIEPGKTGTFTYTVQPAGDLVTWAIGDPDLAAFTVNPETKTVTIHPVKEGATVITGKTASGLSKTVNLNLWYEKIRITYSSAIIGGDNDHENAIKRTFFDEAAGKIGCGERVRFQIELGFPQAGLKLNGAVNWTKSADFREDIQLDVLDSGKRITLYLAPAWTLFTELADGGLLTYTVNYGNNRTCSRTFSIEAYIQSF